MIKIGNLFLVSVILLFAFNIYTQTNNKDFPVLNSSLHFNDTTISVSTEVRFINNLISDKVFATMDEEEKKSGYVSVYEYIYTFKNESNIKARVLFADHNLPMSPLTRILQDFYLTLGPNEEKKVKFLANTTPEQVGVSMFVMQFIEPKNKWFVTARGIASFHIPKLNALFQEVSY